MMSNFASVLFFSHSYTPYTYCSIKRPLHFSLTLYQKFKDNASKTDYSSMLINCYTKRLCY